MPRRLGEIGKGPKRRFNQNEPQDELDSSTSKEEAEDAIVDKEVYDDGESPPEE